MQNELGAAISMCHDVLIEGRERDRSLRDRGKERGDKEEDGNKGQFSHTGMEIIGANGAVNHQEAGGPVFRRDVASARLRSVIIVRVH